MNKHNDDNPWEQGTWNGVRKAQLRAALDSTPAQRLAWLEEAIRFAHAAREAQKKRMAGGDQTAQPSQGHLEKPAPRGH